MAGAYYSVMRVLQSYTWNDVMNEPMARTMFTLEKLKEESDRKEEQRKEMEQQTKKARRKGRV